MRVGMVRRMLMSGMLMMLLLRMVMLVLVLAFRRRFRRTQAGVGTVVEAVRAGAVGAVDGAAVAAGRRDGRRDGRGRRAHYVVGTATVLAGRLCRRSLGRLVVQGGGGRRSRHHGRMVLQHCPVPTAVRAQVALVVLVVVVVGLLLLLQRWRVRRF